MPHHEVQITLSPDLEPIRNIVHTTVAEAGFVPVDTGTRLDLTDPQCPPTVWLDVDVPPDASVAAWSDPSAPLRLAAETVCTRVLEAGAAVPRRAGAPHVSLALRDRHGRSVLHALTGSTRQGC